MATINPTNYRNIIRGIAAIAQGVGAVVAGVPDRPFTTTKLYGAPTQEQLRDAGTPYLAIQRGQMVGYAVGGVLMGMDAARDEVSTTEPVWDWDVWVFYPYDPNFPNYDDAADTANSLWRQFMLSYTLPVSSTVQASPQATSTTFAVAPGDGRLFAINFGITVGGVENVVADVEGDVVTVYNPFPAPLTTGAVASQGTCYNSYPYGVRPDYAQLSDGYENIVASLTIRTFEQLLFQFP